MSKPIITDIQKLVREYEGGASACELAKDYKTSANVITKWLIRGEATIRTLSESAKLKLTKYPHPFTGRTHSEGTRRKMRENRQDISGKNNPNFQGKGKYLEDGTYLCPDSNGYLRRISKGHPLADKNGLIGEHVYQACLSFGVDFMRGKDVHHINGIKDDNRIENLIGLTRSEHRRLENNLKKP